MKGLLRITISSITILIIAFNIATAQKSENIFKPSAKTFLWLQAGYLCEDDFENNLTFRLKSTRFGIKGKVLENVGYHLMIEGIHDDIKPQVYQAWIDYSLHPLINIRIGQFKYPFGLEAKPGFVLWKFIYPSIVTSNIVKNMGRISSLDPSGKFRDIGVMISGKHIINDDFTLGYEAMVFNGNGILTTDNNDAKDVVIRGTVEAPYGTHFGVSYYMGHYCNYLYDYNEFYNLNFVYGPTYDENALGLEFVLEHKLAQRMFRLQGEYINATYKTSGSDIEPEGYYIYSAYYLLPDMVEIGLRFSEYNYNTAYTKDDSKTTFGITYYLAKNQLIRLNYDYTENDQARSDDFITLIFQIAL